MLSKVKYTAIGLIIGVSLTATAVFAEENLQLKFLFSGNEITVSDAIILEGKAYVRAKELLEKMGHKVDWNGTAIVVDDNQPKNELEVPKKDETKEKEEWYRKIQEEKERSDAKVRADKEKIEAERNSEWQKLSVIANKYKLKIGVGYIENQNGESLNYTIPNQDSVFLIEEKIRAKRENGFIYINVNDLKSIGFID